MMIGKKLTVAAIVAALVIGAGLTLPSAAFAGSGAKVFSSKFLNKYCRKAQKKIAQTDLKAENVLYEDLGSPGIPWPPPGIPATGFIGSDALPYEGEDPQSPLTTTQYVGYGTDSDGDDYPQAVMCKMKSWDAIQFFYGPEAAAPGNNCADINRKIVNKVIRALNGDDDSDSGDNDWADSDDDGIIIPEIVYDNWETYTGAQWTDSSPAPVAFQSTADGLLHIVGKRLYVPNDTEPMFVGPEKVGVDYCQTIAPAYVRELLLGRVEAPVCDPFPLYQPPFLWPPGPPPGPQPWDCANP